jgi:hypothetical protein
MVPQWLQHVVLEVGGRHLGHIVRSTASVPQANTRFGGAIACSGDRKDLFSNQVWLIQPKGTLVGIRMTFNNPPATKVRMHQALGIHAAASLISHRNLA